MQISFGIIVLALISVSSRALVDQYPMSNAQLWEAADVVAIVEIESGSYNKHHEYMQLSARIIQLINGDSVTSIAFRDQLSNGLADKLGGKYLVFLRNTGDHFEVFDTRNAVIELLNPLSLAGPKELAETLEELGHDASAVEYLGSKPWYPESCFVVSAHCKCDSVALKYSLKKLKNEAYIEPDVICY